MKKSILFLSFFAITGSVMAQKATTTSAVVTFDATTPKDALPKAENKAVIEPNIIIKNNIESDFSKRKEHLISKNTPAVTIVAACNKADTGVGPSIASGNQVCKPICADLPIAPKNKKNKIKSIILISVKIKKTE